MKEQNLTARIREATKKVEEARVIRNSAERESIYHPAWVKRYEFWQNELSARVADLRELLRQRSSNTQYQ